MKKAIVILTLVGLMVVSGAVEKGAIL